MEQLTNEAVSQKAGGARLKKSGGKTALVVVGVVLAVLVIAYLGLCAYASSLDTFQPNRRINGIDVGGLTVAQAQEKLETELLTQEITLADSTASAAASITVADLGYTAADFAGDAQFWMDADKQQSFLRKGWAYLAYAADRWPGGANWPDQDPERFGATIDRLTEELSQAPVDSSYALLDDAIAITKAKDGRTVDAAALRALLDPVQISCNGYQAEFSLSPVPAKVLTAQAIHDEVAAEVKNAGYDAATGSITPEQLGAEFDAAQAQALLDKAEPGSTVEVPAAIE